MIREGVYLAERYEVLERIGAGGMADVYKGRDHKLNRLVAIKVLKREYREDESFIARFRTEAQAAAGLMHPNIVNVYDVGEDRGLYFMVMELVEGITLKEYIEKKGRLSFKEAISISIQMCTGIEVAHRNHIIHRDIKPQNIIISKEGKVKVTDFGIARVVSSNTISSNAMGSVHYTSPEQARGGFSDEKSDIYSVGISIYEMATGRVPFDGENTVAIAVKHLQESVVPPSAYVQDIPHSLEQIILKCMQKSPEQRYPEISLLIMDLKRALIDPEGNFVGGLLMGGSSETVMITPEEMAQIKNGAEELDEEAYEEEYDEDEYDEDDDDFEDDDDYKKGKNKKNSDVNPSTAKVMKILTIVIAVIIVFVVVIMVGKAAGVFKFGPSTTTQTTADIKVPSVVGMKQVEAETIIKKKGLKFKVVEEKESDKYEAGFVSEQKTAAGKLVKKNTEIKVVVSSGLVSSDIEVPDVKGKSESEAQSTLKNAGFKVKTEFAYDNEVTNGSVIKTTPEAGTKAAKDSTVAIIVSKGKEIVESKVPSLIGSTLESATSQLEGAGLKLGTVTKEYSKNDANLVISQGIAENSKVAAGTSVDLVVSKGPKPEVKITVPPVSGMSESNAIKALTNAGLKPEIKREYSEKIEAGIVISATPSDGTEVTPDSTVTITISKGPEKPPAEGGGNTGE